MKKLSTILILMFGVFAVAITAQSPTPTPDYKSYGEAIASGNALLAKGDKRSAETAFEKAIELAKTNVQKADAMVEAAKIQTYASRTGSTGGKYKGTTYTVYSHPTALTNFNSALELPGIDEKKKLEIILLRNEVYFQANQRSDFRNTLARELESKFGYPLRSVIRREADAIASSPIASSDMKANAFIQKARSFAGPFDNYSNATDLKSAFESYAAAADVAGAADNIKANALLKIVEIAKQANDASVFVGANERITNLPKAENSQKLEAYTNLADVMVVNSKFADARQILKKALLLTDLSKDQKVAIHRQNASSYVVEMLIAKVDLKAENALMASARTEFVKAADQPNLTADERSSGYVGNATYIRRFDGARYYAVAHEQLKLAISVPKITAKAKAVAQYEIGETFRLEKKLPEAKAAYLLVTNADPQHFGYAQQRLSEIAKAP